MTDLYIQVNIGSLPAAGKACAAYAQSLFVQNPTSLSPTPAQAADATATTSSTGTATFTGLSDVAYWIVVTDVDGNHWTPCAAARVGNTDTTPLMVSYQLLYTNLLNLALGSLSVWTNSA